MPDTSSAAERSLRARLAANARWAREDGHAQGVKMRAGLMRKWLDQVDPDRQLPERERYRRAERAKAEHYARLALKSATTRRKAKEAAAAAEAAAADLAAAGQMDGTQTKAPYTCKDCGHPRYALVGLRQLTPEQRRCTECGGEVA